MKEYIVKRVFLAVVTIFVISAITVFCDEPDTGWTVQYGKSIKPGSSKNFRRTLQSGQTGICSVRYVSEKSDAW